MGGESWSPGGSRTDWDGRGLRPGSAGGDRLPPRGAVQVYIINNTVTTQLVSGFYKAIGCYNNGNMDLYSIGYSISDNYVKDEIYMDFVTQFL